jgi:YD repeat-containing protein
MTLKMHDTAFGRARRGVRISQALVVAITLLSATATVRAQAQSNAQPEDEYKKLIQVSQDIQPLGDNPFGERIGLYDGSLSFRQVDVTVTGTGPTITVGREFVLHSMDDRPDLQDRAFGDWDIDLPVITTTTANQNNVQGWLVASTNPKTICSSFRAPPSVAAPGGDSQRADWEPASWWTGYQLRIPGEGSQELLQRSAENTATPGVGGLAYPIVTKQDWAVGCLTQASNDPTTEGFLAVGPDGTKYWLDHLSYRYMPNITRPLDAGPGDLVARTDGTFKPMALDSDLLLRREGRMLVTRVEDRFGNWVKYDYSGDLVTDISAKDGRHVTIAYGSGTPRVNSVTVQGGTAGTRTWTYGYTKQGVLYTLTSVTQPDGSVWSFDLGDFGLNAWVDMQLSAGTCDAIGTPGNLGTPYTGSITHPSGLTGTFTVTPLKRGRSNVSRVCAVGTNTSPSPNGPGTHALIPNASYGMGITRKQVYGAGVATQGQPQTWSYGYSASNESWSINCANGCPNTVSTTVTYPDQHAERSTFSNVYDWSESLLQTEEVFDGAPDSTARRRLTEYHYVNPEKKLDGTNEDGRAAAYPQFWGFPPSTRVNKAQYRQRFPVGSQIVTSEGDTYTWSALAYNAFARPTQVQRSSSLGYGITEKTTYQEDSPDYAPSFFARWVLGIPLQTENLTEGVVVKKDVYELNGLTLSQRYKFGRKVVDYTFDEQGELASFTDGNGHTTALSNYKRGIPQLITYPAAPTVTTQSLLVNDFGQIASITNQAGATMTYGYDAIGRIASITYPADDSIPWNTKTFSYAFGADAIRELPGAHWQRSVVQGAKVQLTAFDAMLRPVIDDAYGSDGTPSTSTRTDYDWKGRKTFRSYAYPRNADGALPALSVMNFGVADRYDALGRPTQSFQHSELGDLYTATEYLPGGEKRTTDPRGKKSSTWAQAFDQPSYESVTRIVGEEGVEQTISRDTLGYPRSITQVDGGKTISKTMTYDDDKRLCRSFEPESGSQIMDYDAADNLVWSVSGSSFNVQGACGRDQVTEAAKTLRGYDAMNRLTSVTYPMGTPASTFSYDALGNPSGSTVGDKVTWTFGRSKLGVLTAEVLAVDGWNWPLGYEYDGNGALSKVHYPNGDILQYHPDALGRPAAVENFATSITYFPDGDVESYNLGNGAIYSADKNDRKLPSNFTYAKGGVFNVSEDLLYDAAGNVAEIKDVAGNGQRKKVMTYDGLNRLTSATADNLWGSETYTYDTLNNIRSIVNSSGTNTYSYNDSNLLTSISNASGQVHAFTYDARGNTVVKDTKALTFDDANRLVATEANGGIYLYDAAGRRVEKKTPSATTYYAYNSAGQLMFEYDNASTNGTNYIYLGKKLIASSRATNSVVIGAIDRFVEGASASLGGWTCSTGMAASLDVRLYAGGSAGTGTSVGVYHANLASEAALQSQCHSTGNAYRFTITFAEADRIAYAGQPLYVNGISITGGADTQLTGSGTFNMPASVRAPVPPASTSAALSGDLSTITVNWSATANTTSYKLEQQYNGSANWTVAYTGTARTTAISNPADGTYTYRARGCNAISCGDPTVSNTVTVAHIPPAPSGISVPATSTGAVPVSWPAAAYATLYRLEHTSNGAWSEVYAGAATSTTINEGASGGWYYRIRACNANGCSGYTTSGVVSVLLPPTTPPTLNGGGTSNNGAYGLNWSASPGATSYNLIENVNGAGWTSIQNNGAQSWSTSGRGNATYYYMVQGCNASACTNWSNQVAVTVSNIPPTPPRPTATVHVVNTIKRTVRVDWAAQPYATRYELMENNVLVYGGTDVFYSNLQAAGDRLTYVVRACNASGCSAWSASVTANP